MSQLEENESYSRNTGLDTIQTRQDFGCLETPTEQTELEKMVECQTSFISQYSSTFSESLALDQSHSNQQNNIVHFKLNNRLHLRLDFFF